MRVEIDDERCQGHTLCNATAPDLFQLREEDGHAYTSDAEVPAALEAMARRAEQGCPEQAIRVISDD